MDWYYANGGLRSGPVSQQDFDLLVQSGTIQSDTLVWHEGLREWQPYGLIAPADRTLPPMNVQCSQCGKILSQDEAVRYRSLWVCSDCKPAFFQRVREGQTFLGELEYIGFWPRVGAKLIDSMIMGIAELLLMTPFFVMVFRNASRGFNNPNSFPFALYYLTYPIMFGLGIGYHVFFLSRFGATPGKMVLGIKVVTSDGGPITKVKALLRYLAELLSGLICYVGYLMVAFDKDEHKALHDIICDTRVVRK